MRAFYQYPNTGMSTKKLLAMVYARTCLGMRRVSPSTRSARSATLSKHGSSSVCGWCGVTTLRTQGSTTMHRTDPGKKSNWQRFRPNFIRQLTKAVARCDALCHARTGSRADGSAAQREDAARSLLRVPQCSSCPSTQEHVPSPAHDSDTVTADPSSQQAEFKLGTGWFRVSVQIGLLPGGTPCDIRTQQSDHVDRDLEVSVHS